MAEPCATFEDCRQYSTALLDHFTERTTQLAQQYANGEIGIQDWQITMREELRQMHALQVVVGAGGQADQVHANDWLRLGAELQKQDRYLENFAHDIVNNGMSGDAIASRAALYARGTQASFYREASPVTLPAEPRDGSTPCLGNCDCEWDIAFEYDDVGNPIAVLATWKLGSTEKHCDVCPARAEEWNPLRIEI